MFLRICGGWRFLSLYAIGFVTFVLFYTIVIYGRIQPFRVEPENYHRVYDEMWSLVSIWSVVIFVAMLLSVFLTFPVRKRLMAFWQADGRREVYGAIAATTIWLAVSLIAVPVYLYINWLNKYSDILINGQPFYGPSPEYVEMYLVWFVAIGVPVTLACAVMFKWRKQVSIWN